MHARAILIYDVIQSLFSNFLIDRVHGLCLFLRSRFSLDFKLILLTTFDQIVEVAESPINHMQLIKDDITFNGVAITEDLGEALEAFRAGEYKKYGFQLGKILSMATKKNENLFLY